MEGTNTRLDLEIATRVDRGNFHTVIQMITERPKSNKRRFEKSRPPKADRRAARIS
ncbi:MAG: hypothetical protein ABJ388_14425 [Alphaproteobacteria bacterium]|tara:strand:+ start:229 stop:396 length:168 start_codon:yes stop_codon:yes gene_type:complete